MNTKYFPIFALSILILSGCSFLEDNSPYETVTEETAAGSEEINSFEEYSHIEIIQETTAKTQEIFSEISEDNAESEILSEETQTEAAEEDILPVDEESISAAYSLMDGSDIIFFGNIYYDTSLDSCGVIFLTADGRTYGGICGYLGNFRSNSYMDYMEALTDITEFGQLPSSEAELMTKYALSADIDGDYSETEEEIPLECVLWYECVTYTDSGEPVKILAHAEEYGYSYSTHDIYAAKIAAILAERGILGRWQEFCKEELN